MPSKARKKRKSRAQTTLLQFFKPVNAISPVKKNKPEKLETVSSKSESKKRNASFVESISPSKSPIQPKLRAKKIVQKPISIEVLDDDVTLFDDPETLSDVYVPSNDDMTDEEYVPECHSDDEEFMVPVVESPSKKRKKKAKKKTVKLNSSPKQRMSPTIILDDDTDDEISMAMSPVFSGGARKVETDAYEPTAKLTQFSFSKNHKSHAPTSFVRNLFDELEVDESSGKFTEKHRHWMLDDIKDLKGKNVGDPEYNPATIYIPDSAFKKMTNFELQYWKIKQLHMDKIVWFLKGKFYETFEGDALRVNELFDLKVTGARGMKMAGVPHGAFSTFAGRLINKGITVGRVDQIETNQEAELRIAELKAEAKREKRTIKSIPGDLLIVKRDIVEIISPGTIIDDSLIKRADNNYILTFCYDHDKTHDTYDIGLCMLEASTGEFITHHFADSHSLNQLSSILIQTSPSELLFTSMGSEIKDVINECVPDIVLTQDVRCFVQPSDQLLTGYCNMSNMAVDSILDMDERCKACFVALCKYLEKLHIVEVVLRVAKLTQYRTTKNAQEFMYLDIHALKNLEIFQNADNGSQRGSLFHYLSHTKTAFGKRLLKLWLSHPIISHTSLNERYDCVQFLVDNNEAMKEISRLLDGIPDFERQLTRIYAGGATVEKFVTILISLQKFFTKLKKINATDYPTLMKQALTVHTIEFDYQPWEVDGEVFECESKVVDMTAVIDRLEQVFSFDHAKKGFFTVQEIDEEFSEAESIVSAIKNDLDEYLNTVRAEQGLDIRYKHLNKEKYQLEVNDGEEVPDDWMMMSKTKAKRRYHTAEIKDMVHRLEIAELSMEVLEKSMIKKLQMGMSVFTDVFSALVTNIAVIDVIHTFASISLSNDLVRPTILPFNQHSRPILEMRNAKHPLFRSAIKDFVPNDVLLGGDSALTMVLSSPNLSGKSVLSKSVCVNVLLAQVGCFVDCQSLTMTPCDRIFSRTGAHDSISSNSSTFMVELKEIMTVMTDATSHSLVILDECGRGTSVADGYALAYSILEYIVNLKCRSVFSTHYHSLVHEILMGAHAGNAIAKEICLFHMAVVVTSKGVKFLYKLQPGGCSESFGIQVASLANLPKSLTSKASVWSENYGKTSQFSSFSKQKRNALIETIYNATKSEIDKTDLDNFDSIDLEQLEKFQDMLNLQLSSLETIS
ncbi:hypothetical protein PCE1_004537 [Barthelona sp. PCE]